MLLFILKAITYVVWCLPLRLVVFTGGVVGRIAHLILKKHRGIAAGNLRLAYGGALTEAEISAVVKKVFINLGIIALESMRIPWMRHDEFDKLVTCEGMDNLRASLSKGKGVIIMTGHFGNWELLAVFLGRNGVTLDVVVREPDSPVMNKFITWLRKSGGNRIISKNRSMRKLMRVLNDNGVAAILIDQNVASAEGVFVDYFGTLACTNKGPAMLAMATGAAVLPTFIIRKGAMHHLVIGPEIPLTITGDKQKDTLVNTAAFTAEVEKIVRKYPEQWFWVHRRWKTRPGQKT